MSGEDHWRLFLQVYVEAMKLWQQAQDSDNPYQQTCQAADKMQTALDLLTLVIKAWPNQRKGLLALYNGTYELRKAVQHYAMVDVAIVQLDALKSRSEITIARKSMDKHVRFMQEAEKKLDARLLNDLAEILERNFPSPIHDES